MTVSDYFSGTSLGQIFGRKWLCNLDTYRYCILVSEFTIIYIRASHITMLKSSKLFSTVKGRTAHLSSKGT